MNLILKINIREDTKLYKRNLIIINITELVKPTSIKLAIIEWYREIRVSNNYEKSCQYYNISITDKYYNKISKMWY